jgi:FkbM family methyltransferase
MQENFVSNIVLGVFKKIKNIKQPYKKWGLTWFNLRYIKNMPENKINSLQFLGNTLYVNGRIGFIHALKELYLDEIYKIELQPSSYIIDCGANIGLSVIYFKHHYPDAKILAFEPDELNFSLIEKNIKSYRYENVQLRKEAVWIENTYLSFSNEGSMASKIDNAGTHKIKASRLKEFLNETVHLLKIDIEGAEYVVMKDIQENLHLVENLFLEYHGRFNQNNELVEMLEIVSKAGFNFYIKEAASVYSHPFIHNNLMQPKDYDVQLNIFCFRR